MLNKLLIYATLFFVGTTVLFFGIAKYKGYELGVSTDRVDKLETEAVVSSMVHDVKLIEVNQSIIFKKEKEIKDEEIPSSVGSHTIDPN